MTAAPIPSGSRVVVDNWLHTRVLGHGWCPIRQTWSYRIAADRSTKRDSRLFHATDANLVLA